MSSSIGRIVKEADMNKKLRAHNSSKDILRERLHTPVHTLDPYSNEDIYDPEYLGFIG